MPIQKQLSVFVENKVGSIYELCSALAQVNVNIIGILVSDDVDWGVVRIVVNDVAKAKQMLNDSGYVYGESEVIVIQLENNPGALAAVAEKLSKAKIVIEYSYATGNGDNALAIISTNNNKKAEKALS
jgi:hypothetical protein